MTVPPYSLPHWTSVAWVIHLGSHEWEPSSGFISGSLLFHPGCFDTHLFPASLSALLSVQYQGARFGVKPSMQYECFCLLQVRVLYQRPGSLRTLQGSQLFPTMRSSGQKSHMLFLVCAGATNPAWDQPLVFLELLVFLLSDIAFAGDSHIHHHCCPLMFIHHHYGWLISQPCISLS